MLDLFDVDPDPIKQFSTGLRGLIRAVGFSTNAEVAERPHIAASGVSRAVSGKWYEVKTEGKEPSRYFPATVSVVRAIAIACRADPDQWLQRRAEAEDLACNFWSGRLSRIFPAEVDNVPSPEQDPAKAAESSHSHDPQGDAASAPSEAGPTGTYSRPDPPHQRTAPTVQPAPAARIDAASQRTRPIVAGLVTAYIAVVVLIVALALLLGLSG